MVGDCSFSMGGCLADLPLIKALLPHVLENCQTTFCHRLFVFDDLPKQGQPKRDLTSEIEELSRWAQRGGYVDEVLPLSQTQAASWWTTHFSSSPRPWLRDYRGVPLGLFTTGLTHTEAPYHVHFDSDILLAPSTSTSWVEEAIRVCECEPRALFLAPHPGPPIEGGDLAQGVSYRRDEESRLWFDSFSSRRYLVSRTKLKSILPLPLSSVPARRTLIRNVLQGRSPWNSWEMMMQGAMQQAEMCRVHLPPEYGWTLHLNERSQELFSQLSPFLEKINCRSAPQAQRGHYDFIPQAWGLS